MADGRDNPDLLLRRLADLQNEFDAYRRRSRQELEEAQARGRDDVVLKLVDLVDDCDRALELMYSTADHTRLLEGMKQLRDITVKRFGETGMIPFGKVGEDFDHNLHNAIAAEEGPGRDGHIVRIHQRGWKHEDGSVVRPAMVTVRKGGPGPDPEAIEQSGSRGRRHQVSHAETEGYQCPFGVPGCVGNCPSCRLQHEIEENRR